METLKDESLDRSIFWFAVSKTLAKAVETACASYREFRHSVDLRLTKPFCSFTVLVKVDGQPIAVRFFQNFGTEGEEGITYAPMHVAIKDCKIFTQNVYVGPIQVFVKMKHCKSFTNMQTHDIGVPVSFLTFHVKQIIRQLYLISWIRLWIILSWKDAKLHNNWQLLWLLPIGPFNYS